MTTFKETLLEDLLNHQRQLPAARSVKASRARWRAPVFAAAGVGVLAAAAVTISATLPARRGDRVDPVPAAYTVVRDGDDTVTFTVRRTVDEAAATRDLQEAGINATVRNVSRPDDCPTSIPSIPSASDRPVRVSILPGEGTLQLSRRIFGEDRWLIVVAPRKVDSKREIIVIVPIPIAGPAPDCVAWAPTPTR